MLQVRSFIRRNSLLVYFIFTYIISWAFLTPCYRILLNAQGDSFPLLALIGLPGAYGPSIAAIVITLMAEGRSGFSNLLKKFIEWRIHLGWYLFVFLVPVALLFAAIFLSFLFGGSLGRFDYTNWHLMILSAILVALPFGPLGEELGWRGYALPRLQEKYSPLVSSAILGVIWAFWHIPAFTFPGAAIPSIFEVNMWTILLYLGNITGEAVLFTAVYNRTKGSVLIAVIFHTMFNASANILYSMFPDIGSIVAQREIIYVLNVVLMFILGILILRPEGSSDRMLSENTSKALKVQATILKD